jgi:hypothetical protein
MSGYAYATGPCINCGKLFSFNPHRVPSTAAVTGKREPFCRECMVILNAKRVELGHEPFPIAEDAYDPIPESEL